VAICMEHCLEMVVGVLGILKSGGAYLPLDPAYPKDRLTFMLSDSRAPTVVTLYRWRANLPDFAGRAVCLDSDWESIARESEENPASSATPRNLAYVMYTSGSTGLPKGVTCEHGSLVNYLSWVNAGPLGDPELSIPLTTKLTFDMCLKQLFPPLLRGGEVWILPEEVVADPAALLPALAARKKVALNCVPSLWRGILHAIKSGQAAPPGESLACLLFGGEPLSKELVVRSLSALPHLQIWNIYGPTEATANASAARITSGDEVTIGRPIANVQIHILNSCLHPVPIGVQGELYIGGAGVARGYLNRPELTAEKFIPNPFSGAPGARLYKTGDLARYRPDGTIEFLGRADQQVKIRGFRIELGEIEAALGQHPAVREAVVLAREDEVEDPPSSLGAEKRLVAYVVAEREQFPTTTDLRNFLRDKLPEHMVPAVFVSLDALPLMPNGKTDRRALRAPDQSRPELDQAFLAPRSATEELLVDIWVELLGIERIGVHDNFFDLGGHSLLATQLVSRVREAFQVEIPVRRLFEAPTVAGLAESIEAALQAGQNMFASPILPVPRHGDLALSFAQQRLWFFDQLEPGHSAYNIPAAVRLKGPLNLAALERSLNEIVERHESLRTTFGETDGRPTQVIAPTLTIKLPVVDLRALPTDERETEVQRLVAAEAKRPFDLARGPLLRGTLLLLNDQEQVGLLTMHHIVSDGWSTGILVRELGILYIAFCAGGSSPLPPLPIQYADFAHWQRQWLQGDALESQLAYWTERLAGAPTQIDLPIDRPRQPVQTFRGAHQSLVLSKHLQNGIKALSRQEGVTLFMTYLAAFKVLLHRYTNQDDVIVGTPIANRNRLETEGLIGFFVNALVLRTDLSGNQSFRDLLRRVRDVCLGAYGHQDLPFDRLVEELHVTRDLSRNPLFQVMFVLHNASLRTIELPGLTLSPVEGDSQTAHFDLTLQIADTDQGPTAILVYNTDLFDAGTIVRMLDNFRVLLEAMVADPELPIADLPLLTSTERQKLLAEWNGTGGDRPPPSCVHRLFEAQVERTPDAIAVISETEQLTYAELNRRANQLAHRLKALGVEPEVPVALCLDRSLEAVIGLLGVLKAGGAYVPVDPRHPMERLAFMLKDAGVPILLTRERLAAGLADQRVTVICLDSGWEAIARESEENPAQSVQPDDLAYVIYTSGSSGQPKGVLVSHGSIAGHCRNVQNHFELDTSDVVLQFASLSFDVSLEEILPTLIAGARLVVMGTSLWNPAEFHRKISEFGLTVLNLPTAYWQELAREWADAPELVPRIKPRLFVVGGEAMPLDTLDLWQRTPMRSIRLLNAYGPTETTITATTFEIAVRPGEMAAYQRVPIGHPLANRTTYILDQRGNPVPIGVRGHLHIGGDGLARDSFRIPSAAYLERGSTRPATSPAIDQTGISSSSAGPTSR
jgi:amino acid adenylation domain-containing protein